MEIRHIGNHDIDKGRWDNTVKTAPNGSVYAFSWYLDAVCPGWEALVTEDYNRIMPLTRRKRFGIHYLFQPPLTQQLGIISGDDAGPEEVARFINSIPPRYKLAEITLNRSNELPEGPIQVTMHTTYRLGLSTTYEDLLHHYSENTKRNLKKAGSARLEYHTGCPPVDFYRILGEDRSEGSSILNKTKNKAALASLVPALINNRCGTIHGVRNRNGRLVAALLSGYSHHTHYYLVPAMNQEGRDVRAMFYLIDRLIHHHSGTLEALDFEGSDIESIARFYAGFGALPSLYPALRFNRLPWPANWLADRRRS